MAHFAGEQLVSLFSLFAAGNIQKDAGHLPVGYVGVLALPSSGYPAPVGGFRQNTEVNLIWAGDRTCCDERRPNPVAVGRMYLGGKMLERQGAAPGHSPKFVALGVHQERVVIHVPRPERDARCLDGAT